MSIIKCARCHHESYEEYSIFEEGQVPVCDPCIHAMCKAIVEYDGNKDLVEHLQTELTGSRCPYCYEKSAELDRIRYGSPVDAFMNCSNCGITHIFDVHIEFV